MTSDDIKYSATFEQINESAKLGISATGQSDSYALGMCNGIEWMRGVLTNTDCNFFHSEADTQEKRLNHDTRCGNQTL